MVQNTFKPQNIITLTFAGLLLSLGISSCGSDAKKAPVKTEAADPTVVQAEKDLRAAQVAFNEEVADFEAADKQYMADFKAVTDKISALDTDSTKSNEQKALAKNLIIDSELKAVFLNGKKSCEENVVAMKGVLSKLGQASDGIKNYKKKNSSPNAMVFRLEKEITAQTKAANAKGILFKDTIAKYQSAFDKVKASAVANPAAQAP